MFKHPLISYYILNVFSKLPIHPMGTRQHILETMCYRIIVSVFQRRISRRYINGDVVFNSIEMEIADSGREGTCVASVTITAEPKDWEGATRAAVEARPAPVLTADAVAERFRFCICFCVCAGRAPPLRRASLLC